jgi:hypothetical protein
MSKAMPTVRSFQARRARYETERSFGSNGGARG